jgi:serine/threonine protein kinase
MMTTSQNSGYPGPSRPEPSVTAALEQNVSAVELVRVLDDYLADLQAGKAADRSAVLAAHPQLAGQLEQCLAGIEFIHRAGRTAGELPAQLGDFRIRREIGRGGMGVVFEAEQLSLHRIVALKILRFGVADKEALDRFRYEAETVAKLHHTNIVPIFAIGSEHGVNFYAMQYIQGRSLADVIQRRRPSSVVSGAGYPSGPPAGRLAQASGSHPPAATDNGPLTTDKVSPSPQRKTPTLADIAGWGLQAAEALAHAHGRGVIHRDIKPSNLLLDDEGTLWLTDFGLAKRIDEVTLTLTGAILGTPRYMSPEQAAATRQPVDHRTDIYSLGATLYELVTGQPVFAAATPHEVISQIITAEPRPPRHFDRSLPRDLETIVLKCLAKEPTRRYQTAHELADDLRAFLDGRPIAARRLGVLARATRWVKKRRKMATTMAAVATCVAALFVGGFVTWRLHEESLLGRLNVSTSGPSLVAEVLDNDDRPVVPSFPVPSSQPVALREGSYQVRLSSPGMLSQTYPLEVERGSNHYVDARLEDRWMWPPLELKPDEFVEPVKFGERTDLLVYRQSDQSLRRLDGATGKPVWPQILVLDKSNLPAGENLDEWKSLLASNFDPWQSSWLATPAADLDGDGAADLIFASRKRSALIAVSGKTGKVLWLLRGRPKPRGVDDVSRLQPFLDYNESPVIGQPVTGKVDGDETARVVGCFASGGETFKVEGGNNVSAPAQSWLEAVSGRKGRPLWRYPFGKDVVLSQGQYDRWSVALQAIAQPQIARVGEGQIVLSVVGTTFYGVELATGKEAWPPLELGFTPDSAPQIVDLGNGQSEALFTSGQPHNGSSGQPVKLTLTAISLNDRRKLWEAPISGVSRQRFQVGMPAAPREIEVELLGPKDEPAILAAVWQTGPEFNQRRFFNRYVNGRSDLELLDATTGKARWEKSLGWLSSSQPALIRWLLGPDLDGDGEREIFVAWNDDVRPDGGSALVVAALSGHDGRTLWRWVLDGANTNDPQASLRLWQPAENGWPLLVVPVGRAPGGQPATFIFDSATGRLRQTLPGVSDPRTVDLDGDGLADLLYTVAPQGFARLMAVHGAPPSAWRRLDQQPLKIAQDFDGDGVTDVFMAGNGTWMNPDTAISGRDGRTLWRVAAHRMYGTGAAPVSAPLPLGDLGGDGHPAIVTLDNSRSDMNVLEVAAFSGVDGRRIWPASGSSSVQVSNGLSSGSSNNRSYYYPALAFANFGHGQRADVLAAIPDSLDPTSSQRNPNDSSIRLNVLSGDSGKLRWTAAVALGQFGEPGRFYRTDFQDLNGDGVADVVAWVNPAGGKPGAPCELRAFSGVDGAPLWTDAPPIIGPASGAANFLDPPAVGDLDGKGVPDVLFIRQQPWDAALQSYRYELVAIGGRDGRVKWTWSWVNDTSWEVLPSLLVDFEGAGRRSVCLYIAEVTKTNQGSLHEPGVVILDGAGKVRRRVEFRPGPLTSVGYYSGRSWWRAADLNGDGKEKLLFYDGGKLQALEGERLESLWKWPVPEGPATLLDVLPAGKTFPATIAVWAGKSVYGLSGVSGRPRWRGEMPYTATNPSYGQRETVLMPDSNALGLPRLLAGDGCRLTWLVDDQVRYLPPRGQPTVYAPLSDPVSLRPLPWAPGGYDNRFGEILGAVPWTLLWFVVPVLLIRWAFKRNSWRLAFVPALYQLALTLALRFPFARGPWGWDPRPGICCLSAAFLIVHAAWMIRRRLWALVDASAIYAISIAIGWSQRETGPVDEQLGYAWYYARPVSHVILDTFGVVAGGLPVIAAAVFIVLWLRRRQWVRLSVFLAASIVLAGVIAIMLLDKDRTRMSSDETYGFDGWYFVLFKGIYFAASLTLLAWAGKLALRFSWRGATRLYSRLSKKAIA